MLSNTVAGVRPPPITIDRARYSPPAVCICPSLDLSHVRPNLYEAPVLHAI